MDTRIDILKEQLKEIPESFVVWEELGDLYAQAGNCKKAVEAYDFVLALRPNSREVYRKKILQLLADSDESNILKGVSELETYCQDNPQDKEMYTLRILFLLTNDWDFISAQDYLPENNPDYSLEEWEQNLRKDNVSQEEYLNIVNSYIFIKQYERAERLLKVLIQLHSNDYLVYIAYGMICLYTNRLEEAKLKFGQAYYYTNDICERDTYYMKVGLAYFYIMDYKTAYFYLSKVELKENKEDIIPYRACCCLENGDKEEYFYYIAQFDKAPLFCVRNAFKNHVPKNMSPQELIPFLKELYQRYNF